MKIIFDFDGTLVDSMPRLRELGTYVIEDYYEYTPDMADDAYMATIGRTFREQLDLLFPDSPGFNKRAADAFYEQQAEIYDSVKLHPGVIDTVDYLNSLPVSYFAVSSTHGRLVTDTLGRLLPEFKGLITGNDFGTKMSQLHSIAKNATDVFIADSIFDGDVAEELGIRFAGVSHTVPSLKFYEAGFDVFDSIPIAVDEVLRGLETTQEQGGVVRTANLYLVGENGPEKTRG